jgi:tetratricopeptide (TPR) repeat protein
MLIDRTSFEETDDFSIAPEAILESYQPPNGKPIKMKNGKVRRKMRWRVPKNHAIESSLTLTETPQKNPTSPFRKRPYYTDRFLPVQSIETTQPYEELSPKTTILHEKAVSSLDEIRLAMSNQLQADRCYETEDCRDSNPSTPTRSTEPQSIQVEHNLQAIYDMASEHLRQEEYDEALEVFEEILRGQLTRYGDPHKRVGTAYHNRGIVQMRMGHIEAAVQSYQEAIRIRKATLGDDHADVAVSLAQLGVAQLERQQPRKALLAFRESLQIRRQWYGNDHPKVAKILNNIGCALYELKELEMAKVALEEALKIQRLALKSTAPDLWQALLLGITATQWNLASIQLWESAYEDAAVTLEEVLLVQECVLSEQHPLVQKTRDTLQWLDQQQSRYNVMMDLERRFMAMRDLACGAANDKGLASDDDSSIAGP